MSALIEMTEILHEMSLEESPPLGFKEMVKSILRHPQFELRGIEDARSELSIFIGKGPTTFIRDTKWCFYIAATHLRITIMVIDSSGMDYLRAESQRMKLELMILMKLVNEKLPLEQQFIVDPCSGVMTYNFMIQWRDYNQKIPKIDSLRRFLKYILNQLNMYAELIYFCQPFCPQKMKFACFGVEDHLKAINQFRFFLRNTKKFRQMGIQYMSKIIDFKKQLRQNPSNDLIKMQLDHAQYLYQSNIQAYNQMRAGLTSSESDEESMAKCRERIEKNTRGEESSANQKSKGGNKWLNEAKIASGITNIKRLGHQKILSKDGAHSQIFKCWFSYRLLTTINKDTVGDNQSQWIVKDEIKSQFTYKKCSLATQASKNSFMNEIYLLNYLKESYSHYIGKYFLEVKDLRERNQQDLIYMRSYYQNLDYVIKKSKILSIKERLSITYKIAKGLCFLSSKSILHRDFKPHNIVLDQMMNPFIIDFGSCSPVFNSKSFKVFDERLLTTRSYHVYYHQMPEQFQYLQLKYTRDEYNAHPLFDVYSFGKVICYIFFNTLQPIHPEEIESSPYRELISNIVFLMSMCMNVDPDERPAFGEITSFLGALSKFTNIFEEQVLGKINTNQSEQSAEVPKILMDSQINCENNPKKETLINPFSKKHLIQT